MADDVEDFIRHHDIKLPGLIGHSMYVTTAVWAPIMTEQREGVRKSP